MKKVSMFIFLCLFFYIMGAGTVFAQQTKMIQLEDNVFMHPAKNVLEVRISKEELEDLDSDLIPLCQRLSGLFKDDFDGYVFVRNLKTESLLGGYAATCSNLIEGNGRPLYTDERFPDKKRWRGFIMLSELHLFVGPLLHEICHLFGNAPDLGQVTVDENGNEIGPGGHWGICDANGFLGGFDPATLSVSGDNYRATNWVSQFFNDDYNGFSHEGGNWYYAPLELYLMGLAPLSEVPDLHIYKGISNTNSGLLMKDGTFTAKEVITYTADDLLRKWGRRIPDYTNSPKEFSFLTVVLTDKPVTDEQWASVQKDIERQELQGDSGEEDFPINFWEATRGRGTIKMSGINKSLYQDVTANEIIESLRDVKVNIIEGGICIETSQSMEIQVFSISGMCCFNSAVYGSATVSNLPAGVYLVCVDGKTIKVVVR